MRRILILSSRIKKKKKHFIKLVRKNFNCSDTEVIIKELESVSFEIDKGKIDLWIGSKKASLYDLVLFRGISLKDYSLVISIALCLKNLGIKFFDTIYSIAGPERSKLTSLIQLGVSGIPIPKTIFFADKGNSVHYRELAKRLGLPFVAKELSMQRGKGVFLINKSSDLDNLPMLSKGGSKNEYFFESFIDKDHEYRLLVLGNKVGVWEEKIVQKEGEFRNNVALGAKEIFMDLKDLPPKLDKLAVKVAKTLDLQIAGIDLISERKTGNVFILEANRGPGLTYDEKLSYEFKAIASFLEREAKKSD